MKLIRIASHRSWDKVKRCLGRTPQGLFNMDHPGSYGLCDVTEEEWERIKHLPSVTLSRVKRDTLMKCWST